MDGFLLFNKPILWTSHDAVNFVRRRAGQKSVGHAGTLDPLATGLLLILLGKYTKRAEELMGMDKSYEGTIFFGAETDSYDMDGKMRSHSMTAELTAEKISGAFENLTGKISQTPPAFSALKLNGKKFYELARSGEIAIPKNRDVEIAEFSLNYFYENEAAFSLSCSKGTYVRSLAHDAGKALGCGGVLSSLVRTRIGPFHLKNALTKNGLEIMNMKQLEESLVLEDLLRA